MTPRILYKRLAMAEVVTWTLLILGMVAKYGFGIESATRIVGGIHGFAFLAYCVATVAVWTDKRWSARDGFLGLGSAVIPYLTVPFERWMERRDMLGGPWRLAPGGDAPGTPPERVMALALRSPLLAAGVALLVVAAVFALLLVAGNPAEWVS